MCGEPPESPLDDEDPELLPPVDVVAEHTAEDVAVNVDVHVELEYVNESLNSGALGDLESHVIVTIALFVPPPEHVWPELEVNT